MAGQRSCVTRDPEKSRACCYLFSYEKFAVLFHQRVPDGLCNSEFASSEQAVLLQFFTQCVAVNAQHLSRM